MRVLGRLTSSGACKFDTGGIRGLLFGSVVDYCDKTSEGVQYLDCPRKAKWSSHTKVDRDAQRSRASAGENSITTIDALRIKSSKKCLDRLMTMFHGDNKGQQLKCDNQRSTQSNYVNDSSWPKCISESVSRCARAPRAILNHALIGEYKHRFFLNENF